MFTHDRNKEGIDIPAAHCAVVHRSLHIALGEKLRCFLFVNEFAGKINFFMKSFSGATSRNQVTPGAQLNYKTRKTMKLIQIVRTVTGDIPPLSVRDSFSVLFARES